MCMDDADLDDDLEAYLNGDLFPNMEMTDVEIVWVEDNPGLGAMHIAGHSVILQQLFEPNFAMTL